MSDYNNRFKTEEEDEEEEEEVDELVSPRAVYRCKS